MIQLDDSSPPVRVELVETLRQAQGERLVVQSAEVVMRISLFKFKQPPYRETSIFGVAMKTASPNQISGEMRAAKVIKLSLDGQKRLGGLSKKPPAPTSAMKKLKDFPEFAARAA